MANGRAEETGWNIPLSQLQYAPEFLGSLGRQAWTSGKEHVLSNLQAIGRDPLLPLKQAGEAGLRLQEFGNWLNPQTALSKEVSDKLTSGALGAANRVGVTVNYPETAGGGYSPVPDIRLGGPGLPPRPTAQPAPPTAGTRPSPEEERGEMFRYRSPDDLGPMDPRGYNPDEPYISPEHEIGITDRGGLDEAAQRQREGAMDREQAAMEQPGAFPKPASPEPPTATGAVGEAEEQGEGGPSTLDRIMKFMGDPRTGRLISDFSRSRQRPDASRPYARMGFDAQTREIELDRQNAEKLAQQEAVKRAEIESRERMSQAEIESRERIAGMDRDAMEKRYEMQFGQPITPELAAALGPDAQAWVGRPIDEYRQWKAEQRMKAASEATAAYQLMTAASQMDKNNATNQIFKSLLDNPFAMRFLAEADPQGYLEARQYMLNNGWPRVLPPPENIPPPPGAEGAGPAADDPRRSIWGQIWDYGKSLLGIGGGPVNPSGAAPTVPATGLSDMAGTIPEGAAASLTGAPGGAPAPTRPSSGPFEGLPLRAKELLSEARRQHADDPEALRQAINLIIEKAPPEDRERVIRILGPYATGARGF